MLVKDRMGVSHRLLFWAERDSHLVFLTGTGKAEHPVVIPRNDIETLTPIPHQPHVARTIWTVVLLGVVAGMLYVIGTRLSPGPLS